MEENSQQIVTVDTPLTFELSLGVLIQAAKIAQSHGVYSLDDAEIISKCIRFILEATKKTK